MKVDVAIATGAGQPFQLTSAELDDKLLPQEVLVRLVASGICHTDLSVRDGYLPFPLPGVLGHEGSGIIEAVGVGADKVSVGDHVVLTYPHCGVCHNCLIGRPTYCPKTQEWIFSGTGKRTKSYLSLESGESVSSAFMGQSSFSTHVVATQDSVVKVRADVPLEYLGPLGCGFQTGAGAVLRSLQVPMGSSFACFGSGAVGLAAIMAAKLSGARTIIAVDIVEDRLELAKELGATDVVDASRVDPVEEIRRMTGGVGVHYSLWATGIPSVLSQAFECLSQTGTCGVVGVSPPGSSIDIDIYDLFKGKTIRGILAGDSIPDVLIPELVQLYVEGRYPLDKMVKFYDFSDINQAIDDLESGKTVKPIVKLN